VNDMVDDTWDNKPMQRVSAIQFQDDDDEEDDDEKVRPVRMPRDAVIIIKHSALVNG